MSPASVDASPDPSFSHATEAKMMKISYFVKFFQEMYLNMHKKLIMRCIFVTPFNLIVCEHFKDTSPDFAVLVQNMNRQKQWQNGKHKLTPK